MWTCNFGAYCQDGVIGMTNASTAFPSLTKYLSTFVHHTSRTPVAAVTVIASDDTVHMQDVLRLQGTQKVMIPLTPCAGQHQNDGVGVVQGGGLLGSQMQEMCCQERSLSEIAAVIDRLCSTCSNVTCRGKSNDGTWMWPSPSCRGNYAIRSLTPSSRGHGSEECGSPDKNGSCGCC